MSFLAKNSFSFFDGTYQTSKTIQCAGLNALVVCVHGTSTHYSWRA